MKFQSALFAVAVADIEPLKRLDTLVRSRFHIQAFELVNDRSHSFINKTLGPREYKQSIFWAYLDQFFSLDFESTGKKCL